MPRTNIKRLIDIPNVGKAIAQDLGELGIKQAADLIGKDPYQMYEQLCVNTGRRHDPCVLDIFIAAVTYMEGGPAKKWWAYTPQRKARLARP